MLTRIIAMVVDTTELTLYKEDGEKVVIPQGDPRVKPIVDKVLPIVNNGDVAEVEISNPNSYRDFEEKTGGIVKFFRVAKKKIAHIFGGGGEEENIAASGVFGVVPKDNTELKNTVDEIIDNAIPASADNFSPETVAEDEAIVAVVADKDGKKKIIPDADKLHGQIEYSANLGSTKGVEAFFARLANVIDDRGHSVQDLIRFLEKGDLPIADDGTIVAYKILRERKNGTFVDCYTGLVEQHVGSYVCVDEKLVDKNRRNECSNGLHVARRGYIGCFGGDVVTLIKVAPEDVVTVPHGDPNKVRVMGYHIIAKLSSKDYSLLKANEPMTRDSGGLDILQKVITGQHPEPKERVQIYGQRGTDIKVTKLAESQPMRPQDDPTAEEDQVVHTPLDDPKDSPKRADPKKINKAVAKAVKKTVPTVSGSRKRASELVDSIYKKGISNSDLVDTINELIAIKRKMKVAWANIGIADEAKLMNMKVKAEAALGAEKNKSSADVAKKFASVTPAPTSAKPNKGKAPKAQAPIKPEKTEDVVAKLVNAKPKVNKFEELINIFEDKEQDPQRRLTAGQNLLDARHKAKKSWINLGYPSLSDERVFEVMQQIQEDMLKPKKLAKKSAPKKSSPKKPVVSKSAKTPAKKAPKKK